MRIFTCLIFSILLFVSENTFSQNKIVSGKVTASEDGLPLPGVSVVVKGTSTSTLTGSDGTYRISAGPNDVLVFNFIGFEPRNVSVGTKDQIDVALATSSKQLNEVVVTTALGITRQSRSLGYSAQGVTSEDLNVNKQQNLLNALQGKVAGATITSVGGGPGQGATLRIRGVNSIDPSLSGDPLYVIDGVQIDNTTSTLGANTNGSEGFRARSVGNRASDINPEEIESINILKGGAATALYGMRGSNGVVVITTKRPKGKGFNVNLSSTYGVENINKTPEVQTEYTQGVLGVYGNSGIGPGWGPTIAEAKLIDPSHPDQLFNNYDRAYQTGRQLKNSLSITGGTENVSVYSSVSAFSHDGMMPFTDYKNLSGRLNTDVTINPKLKAGISLSYSNSGGYRYSPDRFGDGLTYWSPRWDVADYVKPDGTQNYIGTNNPIWGAENNRMKDNVNRFIGGLNFNYSPLQWLSFAYRFGVDTYGDNRIASSPGARGTVGEVTYDNGSGFVGEYNANFRTLNSTFITTLTSKITDDINGTLRLGHELYDKTYKETSISGTQLTIWNFYHLGNAKVLNPSQSLTERRTSGFFGEANFDYKNFLYLTLGGRNDISSTLPKENRSFFYPSASLSYVFSDHFTLPKAVSQAKLRLSYAKVGKDASEYATSSGFVTYGTLPTGFTGLSLAGTLGNPNLRPEFTNTYEGGLEMSFLNRRLGFDFTYYTSRSRDQIVKADVSSATGYVTTYINAGEIGNKGVELVINATPFKTKNFTWEAGLNFSANRNKVIDIPNAEELVYGSSGTSSRFYGNAGVSMRLVEGEPYGTIFGSYWSRLGDDPKSRYIDRSLPVIIDANGYPTHSGTLQKILGNTEPDWIGGLSNTFNYKRLTLSTLFDARWGVEKYNGLEDFYAAFGLTPYTLDRRSFRVFEGVLADGTPNTKSVWLGQGVGPDGVNYGEGYYRRVYRNLSEPFVQDASWVRLRSASLSYSIPTKWIPKNVVRNASVTVTGNNLWLYTKYYGLDPESTAYNSGSNIDGIAGFTYPAARTFLFTLNVGL